MLVIMGRNFLRAAQVQATVLRMGYAWLTRISIPWNLEEVHVQIEPGDPQIVLSNA